MSRSFYRFYGVWDQKIEGGLIWLLGKLDSPRKFIIRFVLYLNAVCIALFGLLAGPNPATVAILVSFIFFAVGYAIASAGGGDSSERRRNGLRAARRMGSFLVFFSFFGAAGAAINGSFLTFSLGEHLAKAGCYGCLSLLLYTLPLASSEELPLRLETDPVPSDSPRTEYEKIRGEVAELDRKKRELLDRKAELEDNPDINRI